MGNVVALRGGSMGRLVSKRDAAEWFGVSQRTLERWIEAGCPSVRVGSSRRVQIELVRAWLQSRGLWLEEGAV